MSRPPVTISSTASLGQAMESFDRHRFTALPVTDTSGCAVGMVSIDQLERATQVVRAPEAVAEIMSTDPALRVGAQTDVGDLLELPVFARFGRAAVVDSVGRPLGVLSVTDIQRAIRAGRLRDRDGSAMREARR